MSARCRASDCRLTCARILLIGSAGGSGEGLPAGLLRVWLLSADGLVDLHDGNISGNRQNE
jgi:hypothetical protein